MWGRVHTPYVSTFSNAIDNKTLLYFFPFPFLLSISRSNPFFRLSAVFQGMHRMKFAQGIVQGHANSVLESCIRILTR